MYKIVIDSCGELPENLMNDSHFEHVALEIEIDGYRIKDDDSFEQQDFLKRVKECPTSPKSSCPSPEAYMKAYEGDAENVYVVTLSGKLSGSYNSAVLAVDLYKEEHENSNKNIHVFNSCSASIGETLIAVKVKELEEAGESFQSVVEKTEDYIKEMNTFFVLESLETLRKAGRLSNLKAFVANTLNIKPVMGATDEGTIQQLGQARGLKKALTKMASMVVENTKNCEEKILAISHCNCPERAEFVKNAILELVKFKDIMILDTAGISSMYANDGGVILAV